jgi:integrase
MTGHILKSGANSWELKFDLPRDADGKRKLRYVSFKGSKKAAAARLVELVDSVNKGTFTDTNKITVEQHVRARLDLWKALGEISPKTAERYGELLDRQIAPFIGAKLLQRLTTIDVETWHAQLRVSGRANGGGISNRTIGHAHRLLSKAMQEGVKHGLLSKNVAALQGAPQLSEEEEEAIILTPDQLKALPSQLAGRAMYPRAMVAVFTGLRRGELLALRWRNVDLEEKWLKVAEALERTRQGLRAKPPKSKKGRRTISLPDIVVDVLREHRTTLLERRMKLGLGAMPADALVFPNDLFEFYDPHTLSQRWRLFANDHGLTGITWHSLRHTHASQLIAAGVDVVTVSRRLGHASVEITLRVYSHLFEKTDQKAADAINAATTV